MTDEIQVFAIAQLIASNKMPTDRVLTPAEADVLAVNAVNVARSLLSLPVGEEYQRHIERMGDGST